MLLKKKVVVLTVILLFLLVGCGSSKVNQTKLSIDKNGKVSQLIVENFDQPYYDLEELRAMVEESVADYNNSQDGKKIEIKECKEEEKQGKVFLRLTYASCFDYKTYNQRELYAGSLENAKGTYDFKMTFLDTTGKECDIEQILTNHPSAQVIVLEEPVAVETLYGIQYVSENVEILGETLAKVKSDAQWDNENADTRTDDYAYIIYDGGK